MQVPQCIVKSTFSYKKNTLPAARLGIKLELPLLKDVLCINIQMQNCFSQTKFLTMQLKHFLNFQITFASFLLGYELEMPLETTGNSGFQLASEPSHPHFEVYSHKFLQALKLKVFQAVCMTIDSYLKPLVGSLTSVQALKTWQLLLCKFYCMSNIGLVLKIFFKRGFSDFFFFLHCTLLLSWFKIKVYNNNLFCRKPENFSRNVIVILHLFKVQVC